MGRDGTDALIVLIGGTGDLAVRRIAPALYGLWLRGGLGPSSAIIGLARSELDDEGYRARLAEAAKAAGGGALPPRFDEFLNLVRYERGDASMPEAYERLAAGALADPSANAVFYLSCAPSLYGDAARMIALAGLAGKRSLARGFRRLAVEKPFGTDLYSARVLNALLHRYFDEADIFRVDHYLGKDAVRDILRFRFGHALFEPLWNARHVRRVEIRAMESGGIGERGGYYDGAGALRDMVQNHLAQLLCLAAMDAPDDLSPDAIREGKVRLLRAVEAPDPEADGRAALRAQYTAGAGLPDYRAERFVPSGSATETFVALRLSIRNRRWEGVPFILCTGKALRERYCELKLVFGPAGVSPRELTLRIQPEPAASLRLEAGPAEGWDGRLDGRTADARPGGDPYERILAELLAGRNDLFTRFDEAEEAWRIVQPLLERWKEAPEEGLLSYPAGGEGPSIDIFLR